jgi:receptor protein-tyrosine kinase
MSLVEKALLKLQSTAAVSRDAGSVRQLDNGTDTVESGVDDEQIELNALPRLLIDTVSLQDEGLLASGDQERVLRGQLRQIKRSVMRSALKSDDGNQTIRRTIMVTSALSGDGKTFSTLNLALGLAMERDCSVVLVDADVLKPQISRLLGAEKRLGLLDVLADAAVGIKDVLLSTNIPNLYFLPSGQKVETATELFSSRRMQDVAEQLSTLTSNMLVLFDSSPLLLTSEARVLAGLMQQILIVVKAGVTPQSAVRESMDVLEDASARAGVVLNDVRSNGLSTYAYGYEYGSSK